MTRIILDTGPLIAILNGRDEHHQWATDQLRRIDPPLLTCEAVIAEACFLLRRYHGGSQGVLEMIRRGLVSPGFQLSEHTEPVANLMKKYSDVPMSLADACLVRMAEIVSDCALLTLDSDFRIYRRNGRQVIPLLTPRLD